MTAMLASVRTPGEAQLALRGGADVIDFKDPSTGALGALAPDIVAEAMREIAGRATTSATAGDNPMAPAIVVEAVRATAASGVDIVKIGLFATPGHRACIDALAPLAARIRLVAVLFADLPFEDDLVEAIANAGFAGVMLDTADKSGPGLRGHLGDAALGAFMESMRSAGLIAGLAGRLTTDDIAPLLALAPDYLGFRGALCAGGRGDAISPDAIARVRAAIPRTSLSLAHPRLKAASASFNVGTPPSAMRPSAG